MKRLLLDAADSVGAQLASAAVGGGRRTVVLSGKPGSGRSVALKAACRSLVETGHRPIVVAPPERHVDTCAVALLQIAVSLAEFNEFDINQMGWHKPAPWSQRIADVENWLTTEDRPQRLVLLVDAMPQWAIPEHEWTTRRVNDIRSLVLTGRTPVVVVGHESGFHHDVVVDGPSLGGETALSDSAHWGPLTPVVTELRDRAPALATGTPAKIATVVAAAALMSVDEVLTWCNPTVPTEQVADRLADHVADDGRLRRLWNAWMAGAMAREQIPDDWVKDHFARVTSEIELAVLERCLFIGGNDNGARIEPTREARAAAWRQPETPFTSRVRDRAAAELQERYRDLLDDAVAAGSPSAHLLAAEVLYLGARIGDVASTKVVPLAFADQASAVGIAAQSRSLWAEAEEAFERALEIDPQDAFARHELAFSLDNEALEPARVEEEYQHSIQLEPRYAMWHARLISFLLVRARTRDALDRWSMSRSELTTHDGTGPVSLYEKLHLPIAAVALRRAELTMGHIVLDDVPVWARSQLPGYQAHRHRLDTLDAAQTTGAFVPAERADQGWWKFGPALLSERNSDGRQLQLWIAGGVEFATPERIDLNVAVIRPEADRPQTGTMSLAWEDLERFALDQSRAADLQPGDFLEIGYYGFGAELGGDPTIRVLPRTDWLAGIETPLDPSRYLQNANW